MTKIQIHILDTYLKENTSKGRFLFSFLRLGFILHVKLELTNYQAIKVLFKRNLLLLHFCYFHECGKMKHCFECLFILKVKNCWSTKFVACCIAYESYKTMMKASFLISVCVFHCKLVLVYVFHCKLAQLNLGLLFV
jgi:hypothetical protein